MSKKIQYEPQVCATDTDDWLPIKPSFSNTPYRYDTELEAHRTARICYPCKISYRVRAVKVEVETDDI